jgi:glycoprotein-N-acetylgalactosamine 3-beta-galactosyltransferase
MHDHYLHDYEYFYVCGDDTLLIVENLRNYLHLLEVSMNVTGRNNSTPLYLGTSIEYKGFFVFAGGGSGYVLNRAALKQLVEQALPTCLPGKIRSSEDRFLGKCLDSIGIRITDTADAQGRQRFNGMTPLMKATYNGKGGYFQKVYEYWAIKQGHGLKIGNDLVSSQCVSFHLIKVPIWMKRHLAILYRSCPAGTLLGDDQIEWDSRTRNLSESEAVRKLALVTRKQSDDGSRYHEHGGIRSHD